MRSRSLNVNPYRLPNTSRPSHYQIVLHPDLPAATFTGTETITITVAEASDELILNAVELELDAASLGDRILSVSYEPDTERIHLSDGAPIPAGEHTLAIVFRGILNDKLHGFYRSTFEDKDGQEHVIATTQFEATDARRAFPCWDEPEYKAVFSIRLIVDEDLLAISNGREIGRRSRGDGTVEVTFSDTPTMSTYLVAFVVGPFEETGPVEAAGVPLRVIHRAGQERLASFALEAGAHYLQWLSDYYGIPYQGDKLDLLAIPDFAFGAMENLGAVTFRDSALLVDPDTASDGELQRVSEVIAHELAHMWFGDYVTMKWWNGIWLNEAFATFMEMVAQDDWKPEWKTWLGFAPARSASMALDALGSTRPVEFEVVAPHEADEMFDLLTYQKGSSLVRMLQQFLGEGTFREGVKTYLESHAFANTETGDLWAALERASGAPVGSIMDSWIFTGGHPLVKVDVGGNAISLSQRRFQFDQSVNDDLWEIPLRIAYGTADGIRHVNEVMTGPDTTIDVGEKVDWVLANAGGHGYYRTAYSPALLDNLLARLDDLDPLERYGLVDDAWANVIAGDVSIGDYLEMLTCFRRETEHAIWEMIVTSLGQIYHTFDQPIDGYVRDLISPAMGRLGWVPTGGEDGLTRRLRGLLFTALGRYGQDQGVRDVAASLVPKLTDRSMDPEVAKAVITVTASAGIADYDSFFLKYRDAETPQEKMRYLHALPLFPDPALADTTFSMAIDGRIKSQDGPFVIGRLIGNKDAQRVVLDRFLGAWDTIVSTFPPMLIRRTLGLLWTASRYAPDIHAFFDGKTVKHAEKALAQQLENLDAMTTLRARAAADLAAYLG
jgi:puromycin-sensitive aminopeptidase